MMGFDALGRQLHDKATRGGALSSDEQAQLDVWYTWLDAMENTVLEPTSSPQTLVALRTQVEIAIAQLMTAAQRVQELIGQNDALRCNIVARLKFFLDF